MKVFISGPMSGKPNFNREAFFKAQEELEKLGYSVWNPAWLAYPSDTEFSKDDMHDIDIEALKHCDVIYMLKGWRYSEGARNEHKIAVARELDIMYEEECCYSFKFNLSKAPEKNTSVFDREFAYDEAIKNRTNYQLEAIKENVKEKYNTLDRRIKSIEEELAWDKWKNDLPDNFCSNRIDSLEKQCNDLAEDIKCIKGDIEGQDRRLDCHNKRIMSLTERVDTLSKQKNPFADRIDALEDEVEDIKKSIGTDNLQEQLEKDFDDVYTEFQNTKDKVNEIEFGYINWSSKMSSAIDEMEKVKDTVKGLNSLVATIGERNEVLSDKLDDYKEADEALEIRIKALEDNRLALHEEAWTEIHRLSKEIDKLNTAINIQGKNIGSIAQKRCDDNKVVNNTLSTIDICIDDFNNRLKALEDIHDGITINNTLNNFNIRLKAIEKRLSSY